MHLNPISRLLTLGTQLKQATHTSADIQISLHSEYQENRVRCANEYSIKLLLFIVAKFAISFLLSLLSGKTRIRTHLMLCYRFLHALYSPSLNCASQRQQRADNWTTEKQPHTEVHSPGKSVLDLCGILETCVSCCSSALTWKLE